MPRKNGLLTMKEREENRLKEEEIKKNNKLIVEFMTTELLCYSYYLPQFGKLVDKYGRVDWEESFSVDELKYHKDWNWLMSVVDRIEKLNYDIHVGSGCFCLITDLDHDRENGFNEIEASATTKIGSVYEAILEFIEWYNEI